MQTLLIIAIAMAAGLALSRLMKILNLPNVTGYLIAGVLIGPYVFKLVSAEQIKELKLVTSTDPAEIRATLDYIADRWGDNPGLEETSVYGI